MVYTEASKEGLGAVLYQEQNGIKHVIAYACRGLRRSERNCPAHKLDFFMFRMGNDGEVS